MCYGCVEFLCQYSYKTARGMEHSGWTLTPLCLLWCLPLRLRPLRSQTALQTSLSHTSKLLDTV